jgi:undecaprenyl-diphosphatase
MSILQAIIIAIVEGITEFLPISSTGHMIITSSIMGIRDETFTKTFEIAIQLGAIVAVVVLYWRKFFDFARWRFYIKLIVAVIPALVLGFLLSNKIDALLDSPRVVAISMVVGGIILLFVDNIFNVHTIQQEENISYGRALVIGFWQCVAMIPGVSRSAASIVGGMQQKLTRKLAAEFSFYLAVPTMIAATGYKLLKEYKNIHTHEIKLLALGNVVAFIVAMLAIKFFIGFLQKHGFKIFGMYRIIAGIVLLLLIWKGYIQ